MIPAYVPLHKLSTTRLTSLEDILSVQIGSSALIESSQDRPGGRVRLYLDGLDEVAVHEQRQRIADIASSAVKDGLVSQVVMTSRDYVYGPWLSWLLRFNVKGFNDEQIRVLVHKWLGQSSNETSRFFKELSKSEALYALMRTPLLATLIILVFRQTGRLPENEARLYDIFTDLLSEGWNVAKRILKPSKYGSQIKTGVLRRLAVKVHKSRQRQFKEDDILAAAKRCISLDDHAASELVAEILHDGLVVRAARFCEFAHLSFQEYFIAKHYYGDPSQKGIKRALREYLAGDDWWYQALRFYIGLSGSPEEIDRWLATHEDKVQPEDPDVDPHERGQQLASVLHEFYPSFKLA